jgi:succinate dehydrogenase / fumarate reductase membrane anchor subunit
MARLAKCLGLGSRKMSLQNPIGRVRGLGSAKSGSEHWWAQRVTAVALVPLTLWFIYSALALAGADYAVARAWLATPLNAILMVLLVIATCHHVQLGLQVIVEDYIHGEATKVATLVVIKLGCVSLAVAAIFSVFKVSFGG